MMTPSFDVAQRWQGKTQQDAFLSFKCQCDYDKMRCGIIKSSSCRHGAAQQSATHAALLGLALR